ncbi:MAG TPA: A/G-specific adenine glycosylase [Tenuifilaceae bacterium]|mgnify:FL=1|jgi:A/G-specific adenine glycosylase|nr:A/G-specific adenine glycosylase [Bacteroidales bacterium]HOA08837.1 A/G-specific adenine glycosylase [Tenuifilaceae bacterium]HOC35819.1 A/G-specific adenine glycosylase [Tenuifilaceae bacterium]HOG71481.1 A/G-specific adenine glycosylase [Tenuifilaceae bacterium]HOW21148.1 A/G-specific adenine glycosylase [Tenuifilaceae bacterium]
MDFSALLLEWFSVHHRDLPWRNTSDPYHIWVSEVILQQTRVNQGTEYYQRFIHIFPDIPALAEAPLDAVMKAWQGLGYYTRARNLHAGAKQVMSEFGGKLPTSYSELLRIAGLGPYSAAAVASFAFNEAVPAVDGNVYRILARVFGVFTPVNSSQARREFFNLAGELIDRNRPAEFNQAIIDLGALVCTPRRPSCSACPFSDYCYAYLNNLTGLLPLKNRKNPPRSRYFTYLMINFNGTTFIRKREGNDIWHSLYEFPLIETPEQLDTTQLVETEAWKELMGDSSAEIIHVSDPIKHQLSHITLHARFIIVQMRNPTYALRTGYRNISIGNLQELSVPRLIDSYMASEPAERYFTGK